MRFRDTFVGFICSQGQSPQLCARRYLVDWLAAVCEKFHLCITSRHLTTLLLDLFMDQYDVKEEHLKLVAVGCLLLACKFSINVVVIGINLVIVPISYFTYFICLMTSQVCCSYYSCYRRFNQKCIFTCMCVLDGGVAGLSLKTCFSSRLQN